MKNLLCLLAVLLIIGLGSCGQKDPPPVENPPVEVPGDTTEVPRDTIVMPPLIGEPMIFNKDIIGKWERIAEGPDEDRIAQVEANGNYMEYLPNGEYRSFSSRTNSFYGEFKFIYQTDSLFIYVYYLDNSDGFNDEIYKYAIINSDTLKLKHVYGVVPDIPGFPLIYIYQRIK
jgi:predicted small lipoprotein YifL